MPGPSQFAAHRVIGTRRPTHGAARVVPERAHRVAADAIIPGTMIRSITHRPDTGASVALLIVLAVACLPQAGGTSLTGPLPPGGHRVLFIGNSLTYVNDLPRTLSDLAASVGDTIKTASVAFPDYALVDHASEGSAARAISLGGWEFVLLQQGPSSVGVNRDTLIAASRYFNDLIRAKGGRPALYSVWPQIQFFSSFQRAIESYQMAAQAVNGLMLPGASAWLAAWAADSTLELYSGDGLHPSPMGTYLAALVMYEKFTDHDARPLPPTMVVEGSTYGTSAATVRLLQDAAHKANADFPLIR